MAHWLEEAEREEQRRQQKPLLESARMQDKVFRIEQNYKANRMPYEEFIRRMNDLCERANNLPAELRDPWIRIEARPKESRLNNHLFSFSSSERLTKRVFTASFPFMKNQHYKHIRVILFSVSKEMGKAEIEVKDDYLAKTRLSADDDDTASRDKIHDGLTRVNVVFHYDIARLDKDHALKILDWLAFKNDLRSLPFGEEHFKYRKR